MADAISILLKWDETWFLTVFGVTDYESKLIIKNKKRRIKMQKKRFDIEELEPNKTKTKRSEPIIYILIVNFLFSSFDF